MKRKILFASILIIILALSCMFVACDKTEKYAGEDFSVEILNNETSLGSINQDTIKDLNLATIEMNTTNDVGTESKITYKGFNMSDCINKTTIELPEITNITGYCADGYGGAKTKMDANNINNVFLALSGSDADGKAIDSEDFPLLVLDKGNSSSMYKLKKVNKIIMNFAENDNTPIENAQFSIATTWENDTTATFTITDGQGDDAKTNIIKVTTPASGNTSIEIQHKGADNDIIDLGSSKVCEIEITKNDQTYTYKSYKLSDIISWMKFKNSSGTEISIIDDYTKVGFVCSDDEATTDYLSRSFTKNEITNANVFIYNKDGDELNESRTFANGTIDNVALEDTLNRNRLKYVTQIIVYQVNE